MSSNILITTISIAIALLCWGVELSAQEKKDDKKLEITGYFGEGQCFTVPYFGLGLEYFIIPGISIEGQINYLPNIAYALDTSGDWPWAPSEARIISDDQKYRLLWDINLLFYTRPTKSKRPARLFLTLGMGYQYDRAEYTVVFLKTMEQYKYGYGSVWFQRLIFGAGLKVNIKEHWALRLLYKVHGFPSDDTLTSSFTLGLSYIF